MYSMGPTLEKDSPNNLVVNGFFNDPATIQKLSNSKENSSSSMKGWESKCSRYKMRYGWGSYFNPIWKNRPGKIGLDPIIQALHPNHNYQIIQHFDDLKLGRYKFTFEYAGW